MGIVDEDVARVREQSDIVAVISAHTQLRRVGQRWTGLCPFHTEKSPSFSVNQQEGLYYCFGCRASGDVITFVREMEHLDFAAAVEWLAAKAGIALRYTDRNEGETRRRNQHLRDAVASAVEWYSERLLTAPDAGPARAYLRSRGFDREMVQRYRLGWAPRGWDELVTALKLPRDVVTDAGLGFVNRRNKLQDFFRGRVLFPIFDDQGNAVAFGGRKMPEDEGPKYQNSRENALYNKSRTLYGLNWAKADIVTSGRAVVCEGYTDVIGFFTAGIPRAVATCGTALTEDHIRHLKRYTNRLVLAYDADDAGQAAAERVYEWERRHDIEIAVMALPAGADPDELARSAPERLAEAEAEAQPMLGFRVGRVLAAADLANPEGRARAAAAALDAVRQHPDELVRDQYVMQIADTCRIEPDRLRSQLAQRTRAPNAGRSGRPVRDDGDPGPVDPEGSAGPAGRAAEAPPSDRSPDVEIEAVRLLVHQPSLAERLSPVLFGRGVAGRAYAAWCATPAVHVILDTADTAVADLVARLAVEQPTADPDDVLVRLVDRAASRALADFDRQARTSDDPLSFEPTMRWLKLRLEAIRGDQPSMDDTAELVAWLSEHVGDPS